MLNANAERKIIRFIRGYFEKCNRRSAVVGLSGGLDSAVALSLCVRALGSRRVLAVLLPSPSTPSRDIADARQLARKLCVKTASIPIGGILSSFPVPKSDRLAFANLSARVRMALLYFLAARENGLVVGTGDRSEFLLGYFTKHGDGGADLFPIGNLYKTEVRSLGERLGLPRSILCKPPSPALWRGQTAKRELGFSYDEADRILMLLKKGESRRSLQKRFGNKASSIFSRMEKNRHKLFPAPICKV